MEDFAPYQEKRERDLVFSKAIKAGKRIYYLDVKKSRNGEMFLSVTESKKKTVGSDENAQISFEKHKIFLYKEDFEKFMDGMKEVIDFIQENNAESQKDSERSKQKTTQDATPLYMELRDIDEFLNK